MVFLVESMNKDLHTELYVYSRENGQKQMQVVRNYRPYFYVLEDAKMPDDKRITGVRKGFKAISERKIVDVKKVFVQKSMDVPEVREMFYKHFEADILFTNRFLIDKVGEIEPYPLKVLAFDIETASKRKFPNMLDPDQEVISICMEDNFDHKQFQLLLQPSDSKVKLEETDTLKTFETEESLLNYFLKLVNEYDPDILTGWNVESFDLIYLIRRMDKLGVDFRKLSPLYSVGIDDKYERVRLKGRIIMDMMNSYKFYRKLSNQGRAESYSLEYTSQNVLGTGKLQHEEMFYDMWKNNPQKLIDYNMRDVSLVLELNEKLEIIEFFNFLRCKACAQLTDVFYATKLVDGYLLNKCKNKLVLPSGIKTEGERYSGAFVIEPIPGLYNNVIGVDVKSMYPNIIRTFNMGYETFNPNGEILIKPGIGFNKGAGLIAESLKELGESRDHYKSLRKEAILNKQDDKVKLYNYLQYAVKVIMNSFYGYLGFPKARFYKREVAEAITTMGRMLIIHTKEIAEKNGYKVLYGDTDSIYVLANKDNLFEILSEGKILVDKINKEYKTFADSFGTEKCTLEIQFEKVLKRVLFVSKRDSTQGAKKKYAYLPLWIDGKDIKDEVEFTGFETVRSDTPRVGRKIQKRVLNMILKGATKEEVIDYLSKLDKKIRNREIPDEEFAFPQGISEELSEYGKKQKDGKKGGVPPIVKGAKYANKYLGKRFGKGDKPKWVYVKSVPARYPDTEVITFYEDIPEGFIPDFDKINKRIFEMKLGEIFRATGWGDFPDLKYVGNTLDKWGL